MSAPVGGAPPPQPHPATSAGESPPKLPRPSLLDRMRRLPDRKWWVSFVVVLVLVVVYSVAVGQYLSTLRQPEVVGQSRVGEWADLSDYGFRLRVDNMELLDSAAGGWEGSDIKRPPEGMKFLRVLMTIEALVPEDGNMGCTLTLLNGAGEEIGLEEVGLDGPDSVGCAHHEFREGIGVGDTWESQMVWVVLDEPVENFTLVINPIYSDGGLARWHVTA